MNKIVKIDRRYDVPHTLRSEPRVLALACNGNDDPRWRLCRKKLVKTQKWCCLLELLGIFANFKN